MAERQNIYNIEKQEPHRDLYNIAGNLITNPITHEPLFFPTIQSVLRKGETTKGDFFKKEPEWADYEQGFIVERKEVGEIIKKLENNKVQLVLGAPASGKSIILKNVGFKLASENKVYVVELKKHPQDELRLFVENIPKIDDEKPIFIIDDAHLYFSDCERLIRNFKGRGKGNLIIGSRETQEIAEGEEKEASEFDYLRRTVVHPEDVTERMIKTFLETQHQFDENRIKTISANFERYKKDLWFLSWALKSYDPKKDTVEEDKIYEKIKSDSIEKIKIGKDEKGKPIIINAENVFLPLSIFYRFEIPIERYFLEEQMGIEGNLINQLIGLQEIMENEEVGRNKMLSLNHSSIAKLYFGAFKNFPDLGRRIKTNILNGKDEKDLEFCLFFRYLTTTNPINGINVVNYLRRSWKGGEALLKNLIEDDKIQISIKNGIDIEEDIDRIGRCVYRIRKANKEVALKLAHNIDFHLLSSKIANEKDILKVRSCISRIARANKEVPLELTDSVSEKIDNEEDIEKIGICLSRIPQVSKEVTLKLVDSINIDVLSSKIDKEKDILKIKLSVSGIAQANKERALKLVDRLSEKIDREEDIGKVGLLISGIARANKEVAQKLINSIDIDVLSSKIDKEKDILKVRSCVSGIAMASEEVALKLVDSVSAKITKEKDILKVRSCVSRIARANKEMALRLTDSVSEKIDNEEDIEKIGICLSRIPQVSKEVTLKLVDSINIDVLSSKIDKEKDMLKITSCVSRIAKANTVVANKIVNRLNPKLREELQKE